jgi:predicted TIM-barrel fold metal-dependent hydrolase
VFVETHEQFRESGPEYLRPVGETEYAASQAEACERAGGPPIAGIVTYANLSLAPDVLVEVLVAHEEAGIGRFRGIRQNLATLPDPRMKAYSPVAEGFMASAEFRRGLSLLGERGHTFDASIYHPQLTELVELARAVPGTTLVLNHLATIVTEVPPYTDRDRVLEYWRPAMRELASCPNVVVKIGCVGRSRLGKRGWQDRPSPPTSEEIAALWSPDVRWAIECFGPERCMFESNFPTDRHWVSYGVLWNAFKRMTAGASESELDALFHNTAARVYRLT